MSQFLNDLPLRKKFSLIGVVALAMVAAPLTLVLKSSWSDLRAAQAEQHGVAPARALLKVVRLTQEHRGLSSAVLNGDAAKSATRQERQGLTDEAFAKAVAEQEGAGYQDLAAKLKALQADWSALAGAVAQGGITAPDSLARHTGLVDQQLLLLEDIAAVSGLELDPDAASYHLIMASTRDLPRLTERLGRARAKGVGILASQTDKPEQRVELGKALDDIKLYGRDVQRGLERMSAGGATLDPALATAFRQSSEALTDAGQWITRAANATPGQVSTGEYFQGMTTAINGQYGMTDAAWKHLDGLLAQRVATERRDLIAMGLVVLMTMGAATGLMLMVVRASTRTLGEAMKAAKALAEGQLTHRMPPQGHDEMGQMVNALSTAMGQLEHTLSGIRDASESVASASSQIEQGNQDLSARTEAQASSLQQTASSMEEMAASVRSNASTAAQANELAAEASSIAINSGEVFTQVVAKMDAIKDSSRRIADINAVIDGIAFQTNILALNAAVEAARAGEHGRGFAVVASEVRTLAQRSAQAAREIKGLIATSVDTVEQGHGLANTMAQSINQLIGQVQRVSLLMTEIASSSAQQSQGIAQVNQAVSQLDQATQANAALVEESTAAAGSLRHQAQLLQQSVALFTLT
ncbi:MAG: methyl-accepting chemotaxis protein [Rubrivivax sp.]|nr:MAG: methyl-accepting chemotaxis protein [Rubrivivax sp.]